MDGLEEDIYKHSVPMPGETKLHCSAIESSKDPAPVADDIARYS